MGSGESEAVVTRGQLTGIFVVGDEGKARLRWIKIGRADTGADGVERVEVLSGLKPGEQYVLSPSPGLVDGAPVEVTP